MRLWLSGGMTKARRISILMLALSLGACDVHRQQRLEVAGNSPQEIASSITYMRQTLDAKKEAQFAQAISTLSLVVPDKNDAAAIGYISPQFARLVHGRNVDQIIQLAELYRLSVPMDKP